MCAMNLHTGETRFFSNGGAITETANNIEDFFFSKGARCGKHATQRFIKGDGRRRYRAFYKCFRALLTWVVQLHPQMCILLRACCSPLFQHGQIAIVFNNNVASLAYGATVYHYVTRNEQAHTTHSPTGIQLHQLWGNAVIPSAEPFAHGGFK